MHSFICDEITTLENKKIWCNFQINILLTTHEALKLLSVFYSILSVEKAGKKGLPSLYFQKYNCYCHEGSLNQGP